MESNYVIVIAIIATSLATFISRFMGAITSKRVSVNSKIFQWFNCVAYATLAALLGRMIVFPSYLYHYVQENKSNQDRISVSFNIRLD